MKVWKRVLVKFLILLLVIAGVGGGTAFFRANQYSTPEYAVDKYLSFLIGDDSDKAYGMLDQSEDDPLTLENYKAALEGKKYSLCSAFNIKHSEKQLDNQGNEYVDFQVEFLDAEDGVQMEETFTAKKQSEAVFGIFDSWKIMSRHCMISDFMLTVPTASQVYLNSKAADTSWIVREVMAPSYDCYQIPSILPVKINITVRHPILESVNATLDPGDGAADYSGKMALKESAKNECEELAVSAIKQLYASAAKNQTSNPDEIFAECGDDAKKAAKAQEKSFHKENSTLQSAGISDFAVQFGDVIFTDEESGAITVETKLLYRYTLRENVTSDTEELQEDGTPVQETSTETRTGDNTAKFVMSYYEGSWHIVSLEVPEI